MEKSVLLHLQDSYGDSVLHETLPQDVAPRELVDFFSERMESGLCGSAFIEPIDQE